jgi:hypothetical protein
MVVSTISGFTLLLSGLTAAQTRDKGDPYEGIDVSDTKLVGELKGFKNAEAEVNGVRLHYLEGGQGPAVILMPGWPQTWWAFHKIMLKLAENYHVVAVEAEDLPSWPTRRRSSVWSQRAVEKLVLLVCEGHKLRISQTA